MKRGIATSYMVMMILLIVSFIIVFASTSILGTFIMNYLDGGMCQGTAAAASFKVEKACINFVESPVAISCPRKHVEIGQTETTITVGDNTELMIVRDQSGLHETYPSLNTNIVNFVFAEQLLECWEQFGSGEIPLFTEGEEGLKDAFLGEEKTACFICSEIFFNGHTTINLNMIDYYMTNNPDPEKNYISVLNNPKAICENKFRDESNGCWIKLENYFTVEEQRFSKMGRINPDKGYAVVMMRKRFDWCDERGEDGKWDMSNFAYVIANDELNEACNIFIS